MPPTLTITPIIVTLDVGESLDLTVSPNPNGVQWACDQCHIAKIDNNGRVTGLAFGNCIITGRRGNQAVSVSVTVIDVDPPTEPIPPPTARIFATNGSTEADTWHFTTEGTAAGDGDSIVQHTVDYGDSTISTLPGPPEQQLEHVFPNDGTFTVRLTILTAEGYEQFSEFIAVVLPVESPEPPDPPDPDVSPIAALAWVSGIYAGQPVTFSAANTTDIDGTIVSHAINYGDGTPALTIPLGPPTLLTHTYAQPGTYTARLTVTDDDGLSGQAEVTLTLVAEPTANQPPIPKLVKTAGSIAGDLFVFSTVGSNDPDGSLAAWRFESGTGLVQQDTGNPPPNINSPYPTAGVYVAKLTLTDDDGAQTSVTVSVTVASVPAPGDDDRFNTLAARPERLLAFAWTTQAQLDSVSHAGPSTAWLHDPVTNGAKLIYPPDRASIRPQLRIPIRQTNGTILISNDVWYAPEWLKVEFGGLYDKVAVPQYVHKEFQHGFGVNGGGDGTIWIEQVTSYRSGDADDVGPYATRIYQPASPEWGEGLKGAGTAEFRIRVGMWIRYVSEIRLNVDASAFTSWIAAGGTLVPGTYHMFTQWMLDPTTGPVRSAFRVPVRRHTNGNPGVILNGLSNFWYEQNTSSPIGAMLGPANIFATNFICLKNYILPSTPENDTLIFERPPTGL